MTDEETEEYYQREIEADTYHERYEPQNQSNVVEGICINPVLRYYFDATDNDIRSELEKTHWWGRAYITTEEFTRDTYKEYLVRMKNSTTVETEKQFNSNRVNDRKSWFCHWGNDGVRYNVRCLDGGAWDRSSNKGFFDNLDDALILAREINIENDTLIGEES